ncbi:hypothetical protein DMB42_49055 [Nonomuraea sp. WAC 01424]|nr:hypothetical protein DMB42_49055 [Nonomuraea sp. WAC 01424]
MAARPAAEAPPDWITVGAAAHSSAMRPRRGVLPLAGDGSSLRSQDRTATASVDATVANGLG